MKKWMAFILVAALVLMSAPVLAEDVLISRDGIEVRAQEYRLSETEEPFMMIYCYAANDTGTKVWISAQNATVNGVPVKSAGMTLDAYSEYSEKNQNIMLMCDDDALEVTAAAIANARQIEMDLVVMDNDTYKRIFEQHVSIDALSLGDDSKADFGHGGASTDSHGATAPAYTPASWDFKTLKKGSKGQAVRDLQQRLTDLGYLNDKVDGSYGLNTATAVRSFCDQNGLTISGDASPEMQELLYSSRAEYYVEPWIPLMIGPEYKWDNPMNARDDIGMLYVQLVNRSHRDIRGYELYYYFINTWGDKIDIGTQAGSWRGVAPETNIIKSGYTEYSGSIPIQPFAYTYAVYVGIHKIVFSDGEIREIDPDDVVYFECPVKQ